jgi:anthranilate synthase component 1
MHIVSNVGGDLLEDLDYVDALKATLTSGTLSGSPKKRAMQIISELEESKRNIYCGSIGYFNENNNMDTNICIRTVALHNNTLNFSAGGGIVYDSVPIDEYHESLQKVSIFIKFFSNGDYKW